MGMAAEAACRGMIRKHKKSNLAPHLPGGDKLMKMPRRFENGARRARSHAMTDCDKLL
jgi:hypothetical protein